MTRKWLSLLVGIVVGLVAWWGVSTFLSTSPAPPGDSPPPGATPKKAEPGAHAPKPLPAPQHARSNGADGKAPGPSRESDGTKAPPAAAPQGGSTLHGTVVGIDEGGVERKELDGTFEIHWMEGKERRTVDVTVKAGLFTSEAPHVGKIGVDSFILGERIGRLADDAIAIPDSGEVALRVKLLPTSTLKVVDASTHAELDGIELLYDVERFSRTGSAFRLAPRGDGDTEPVVSGARSPIVLPPVEGTPRYWIHAKGYAWKNLEVQQLIGGEREVALTPGGTLAITLLQKPERDDLELRVEAKEARFRAPVTAATRELADIAPDHYTVKVVLPESKAAADPKAAEDDPNRGFIEVASLECDVLAGQTTRAELVLGNVRSGPVVGRVPFRGVVVGADARLTMDLIGRLSSLDPAQRVPGPDRFVDKKLAHDATRPDTWSFDFGPVLPGRKLVTVMPLQVHQVFEVGPAGLEDARIVLPALGEVEVTVTDATTGAALASAGVSWRSAHHPMADDDAPQSAETRGDPPAARLLAPLGPITVTAWPDSYEHADQDVEVLASLTRVTIAVRHEQYVRVLFKQRSANVPIDPGTMEFALLDAAGKDHLVGWAKEYDTGALKLIVDEPGDYTLRFPKVQGFRAIADRPVRVEAGGTTQAEVELTIE